VLALIVLDIQYSAPVAGEGKGIATLRITLRYRYELRYPNGLATSKIDEDAKRAEELLDLMFVARNYRRELTE
jgi:hypothetical protein